MPVPADRHAFLGIISCLPNARNMSWNKNITKLDYRFVLRQPFRVCIKSTFPDFRGTNSLIFLKAGLAIIEGLSLGGSKHPVSDTLRLITEPL